METKDLLSSMNKYMFTGAAMKKGYDYAPIIAASNSIVPNAIVPLKAEHVKAEHVKAEHVKAEHVKAEHVKAEHVKAEHVKAEHVKAEHSKDTPPKNVKPFTPFQKDKLFWCFYIILKGYEEYEMNRSHSFSIEKQLKIETVEKMKSVKEKLKELKLKRTELEDELVNKQTITLKGLCALCVVHNVSITYIFGRKYCEIGPGPAEPEHKQGIIIQNEKKEDSLKWTTNENNANNDIFLSQIRADYWLIENIQKPLKASSAYTLTEIHDICNKLQIETYTQLNDKSKAKTKTKLYEEILQCI